MKKSASAGITRLSVSRRARYLTGTRGRKDIAKCKSTDCGAAAAVRVGSDRHTNAFGGVKAIERRHVREHFADIGDAENGGGAS